MVKLADTTKEKETKKSTDVQSPNDSNNIIQQLLHGNNLMPGNQINQLSSSFNALGSLLQNPGVAALLGTGKQLYIF